MFQVKRITTSVLLLVVFVLAAMIPFFGGQSVPLVHASTVSSTPDFSMTVTPLSQTRKRGTGAPYFVDITSLNGFTGTVTLSLTGNIPSNCTVSITQPVLSGGVDQGEVDLQIDKHSTLTGTFAMTIVGTSGSLVHMVDISLTIV